MDNKHYIIVLSLLFLMMTIKWEAVNGQRPFFSFLPGEEVPAEYLKEHGHDAFSIQTPFPTQSSVSSRGKASNPDARHQGNRYVIYAACIMTWMEKHE